MAVKLYDPYSYATPTLIAAKVLLQDMWRAGYEWDDAGTQAKWSILKTELIKLSEI